MSRCTHQNCVLEEECSSAISWIFSDGEVSHSVHSDPRVTGAVRVTCLDCNETFDFTKKAARPAWVRDMFRKVERAIRGRD